MFLADGFPKGGRDLVASLADGNDDSVINLHPGVLSSRCVLLQVRKIARIVPISEKLVQPKGVRTAKTALSSPFQARRPVDFVASLNVAD